MTLADRLAQIATGTTPARGCENGAWVPNGLTETPACTVCRHPVNAWDDPRHTRTDVLARSLAGALHALAGIADLADRDAPADTKGAVNTDLLRNTITAHIGGTT